MGKSDQSEERRVGRRFEVSWAVVVRSDRGSGEHVDESTTLQNLSSVGAFFFLLHRVGLGASLDLEIRLPMKQGSWMKYSAKVVRVERQEASFGVAVKFPSARPTFIER